MGSYDYQVSKSFDAGVSLPETDNYQVYDKDYGNQNVTLIAYYDQISNFQYNTDTKTISFVMPFNWDPDNVKQVSVVHQELKIPRTFSDFIVTKYDVSINGVMIPDKEISIDDYSSDERIVHLILYKTDVANAGPLMLYSPLCPNRPGNIPPCSSIEVLFVVVSGIKSSRKFPLSLINT